MGPERLSLWLRHLRRRFDPPGEGGPSDAELLDRFLKRHDEAAFELLLWRHGPMVHAACRRVLRHAHDADDAFQATFLVLVRKAAAIRRCEALGGWLYRVAYRLALRLRAGSARRTLKERDAAISEATEPADPGWGDLGPVLDEEIQRLPPAFRLPFVLCHLEGKTNAEAARELGCPRGTVQSRLTRARDRLRQQLLRRGVGPAAVALAAGTPAAEAMPAGLIGTTLQTVISWVRGPAVGQVSGPVAALTEGVLQAMWWSKVQAVTGTVLILVAMTCGVGGWMYQAQAQAPAPGAGGLRTGDTVPGLTGVQDKTPVEDLNHLLKKIEADLAEVIAEKEKLHTELEKIHQREAQREALRREVEAKLKALLEAKERAHQEDDPQMMRRQKALKALAMALEELKASAHKHPAVAEFDKAFQKLVASLTQPAINREAEYRKIYEEQLRKTERVKDYYHEKLKETLPEKGKGPVGVEGRVKAVKDHLAVISVGSDAGLTLGQILVVFRTDPKPVYLGKLRVVQIVAGEAVCERVEVPKSSTPGKTSIDLLIEGDLVTTKDFGSN